MLFRLTALGFAVALTALAPAPVPAADVVILKDGFVIQGRAGKETEMVFDKASGQSIRIVKANGLDMIDEGPKVTVFSTHARQLGELNPDTRIRPEYRAYTMPFPGRKKNLPLPGVAGAGKLTEFNSKWWRTMTVPVPNAAPEVIEQQITSLDPYHIQMYSATHIWRGAYRTTEWEPQFVRKLLRTHPDLAEPDGVCDPMKRVALARFMLDAGWIQPAKDEIDKLKQDFDGPLAKPAQEQLDKLQKDIDQATAELVAREAESALGAGRYKRAADLLAVFPEKSAGAKEVAAAARVGAELKAGQERYDTARRLLAANIEAVNGGRPEPLVAAGGGAGAVVWRPLKEPTPEARKLADAAARVSAELHPDSALRIETFVALALQAERERAAYKEPTKSPRELLATAVSGWAMGRNGATPSPEGALKVWGVRELILTYQRTDSAATRADLMARFKKSNALEIAQVAQLITLLPPVDAEDLDNRSGKPVALGKYVTNGVYRRRTAPAPGFATGLDYLVKLPPEYHHGRAYPVLVVLTHPGIDAEDVLAPLMGESEKHGYIVIAPEWSGAFVKNGWQWRGEDHGYVTAALRDAVRRFCVDNDRVFLCGVADGANMAMDIGSSHPDLFAGVVAMSPVPRWQTHFIAAWRNAQKLPFYVVTGELGGPSVQYLKEIFTKWTQYGFPSIMTVYKGRGIEWYPAETPVIFDWMRNKKRVNGTATLALGTYREPWQVLRESDSRFYWLEAKQAAPGKNGGALVPATIQGDIRGSNYIVLSTFRVKQATVWLSADMIDWTQPIKLQLNGSVPRGWDRPKKLDPDLEVLLEDYYQRGDRKMLFLNKLELTIGL